MSWKAVFENPARRPRFSKKRNEQFAKALRKVLVDAGAKKYLISSIDMGHMLLPTKAGALIVRAEANATQPGAAVFGWFEDVEVASKLGLDSNPYTGKWNHYYFTDDVESGVRSLRHELSKVL